MMYCDLSGFATEFAFIMLASGGGRRRAARGLAQSAAGGRGADVAREDLEVLVDKI